MVLVVAPVPAIAETSETPSAEEEAARKPIDPDALKEGSASVDLLNAPGLSRGVDAIIEEIRKREVEIALESHHAVRAAAVIGRDDATWGQVGVAFLELSESLDERTLYGWCKARLADYKIPKEFRIVDALPRTPIDKVDRVALSRLV